MQRTKTAVGSIAILLVILIGSLFFITLSTTVHATLFRELTNAVPLQQRQIVDSAVVQFLQHRKSLSAELFTDREIAHMGDVRGIFDGLGLLWFAAVALLTPFIHSRTLHNRSVYKILRGALVLLPLLAVSAIFFFEPLFVTMHELLFHNDYWQLDPTVSVLIRVYDEIFFQTFAGLWFAIVWFALVCIVWLLHKNLEKEQ